MAIKKTAKTVKKPTKKTPKAMTGSGYGPKPKKKGNKKSYS